MTTNAKPRTKGPTSKFTVKPLDEDMFHTLFDILHDGCMEGNYAATARILGLHVNTVRKWAITAPKDPWANHRLRDAINFVYGSLVNSVHKKIRKRAAKVKSQLERAGLHKMTEYLEYNEANNAGAVRHLLVTLNLAQDQEVSTKQLRKPAFSGGYSMRALRQAAEVLQLDKETTGFGDDKETWWRLPSEY